MQIQIKPHQPVFQKADPAKETKTKSSKLSLYTPYELFALQMRLGYTTAQLEQLLALDIPWDKISKAKFTAMMDYGLYPIIRQFGWENEKLDPLIIHYLKETYPDQITPQSMLRSGETILVPLYSSYVAHTQPESEQKTQKNPGKKNREAPPPPYPAYANLPSQGTYTLQKGKTLFSAARELGINLHAWLRYNHYEVSKINPAYVIDHRDGRAKQLPPGTVLRIPPQDHHLFQNRQQNQETKASPQREANSKEKPRSEPTRTRHSKPKKPAPPTPTEQARGIRGKGRSYQEIARALRPHLQDKAVVKAVLRLEGENTDDSLAYAISHSLKDSELNHLPESVLHLLKNAMDDGYTWGSWGHGPEIDRVKQALSSVQKKKKEAEEKKKKPVYQINQLLKKETLSPEEIAQVRKLIEKLKEADIQGDCYERLQYKAPYFNQRDSVLSGQRDDGTWGPLGDYMCNMSAMAMGLAAMGMPNPKPEMQYDDALEKIRDDKEMRKRTGGGQQDIAKHFGYYYGGLVGDKQNPIDNTWMFDSLHGKTYDYNWYENHIIPELRKGNSITIGIADLSYENGHIVHLLGVEKNGIYVHDPMGATYWEGKTYTDVMYTNANEVSGKNATRGKKIFWNFSRIKKATAVKFSWIRVTKK